MLERIQKGNSIYAVYNIENPNAEFDEVSIMMINNNRNKKTGLAPIFFESMNGINTKLLFDVTGKVTISEYLQENHTQSEFRELMLALVETIECFDEYMIELNKIMFELDSVYINMVDKNISFICITLNDYIQRKSMYEFFKDVVSDCYLTNDNREPRYYENVRNIMRTQSGFSLENIKKSLNNVQNPKIYEPSPPTQVFEQPPEKKPSNDILDFGTVTVSPDTKINDVPSVPVPTEKEKKKFLSGILSGLKKKNVDSENNKIQGGLSDLKSGKKSTFQQEPSHVTPPVQNIPQNPQNFGTTVLNPTIPEHIGTTVLNVNEYESPGTTVLSQEMQRRCFLIRTKTNQKFSVDKDVFHIGRDEANLDLNINDNTAIGHKHANIVKRDNGYWLVDLNSRNHTYVNNIMIKNSQGELLQDGDIILFANEEFKFIMN